MISRIYAHSNDVFFESGRGSSVARIGAPDVPPRALHGHLWTIFTILEVLGWFPGEHGASQCWHPRNVRQSSRMAAPASLMSCRAPPYDFPWYHGRDSPMAQQEICGTFPGGLVICTSGRCVDVFPTGLMHRKVVGHYRSLRQQLRLVAGGFTHFPSASGMISSIFEMAQPPMRIQRLHGSSQLVAVSTPHASRLQLVALRS